MNPLRDFLRSNYTYNEGSRPTLTLKDSLIEQNIIDQLFNSVKRSKFPPLEDLEIVRLQNGLKKSVKLVFGDLCFDASIHETLFTILNAASKLPFADSMRIKFIGSFVLSILGRSYIERIFLHNQIDLKISEDQWHHLEKEFKKILRDIDLGIVLGPKATDKNREKLRETLLHALIPFAAKHANKPEKMVEGPIKAYLNSPALCPNIVDGKTCFLRTPLGSSELMLDISWIESKAREKLFEEDDISFEVNLALFANPDKVQEIIPEVYTQTLKPFIDILFNITTVSDPFTVNKRGWAKLILKELKGKKILVEKDILTLFNTAFQQFVKGLEKTSSAFAENFSGLINFCHKEHTLLDFNSHFLLYLQGISNLYYFQNRKERLWEYQNQDIEAIKPELLKITPPKNKEGVLFLLFSLLEDKDMTIEILFDLILLYKDSYGLNFNCQNVEYKLDLKGRIAKDPSKAADLLVKKLKKGPLTESEWQLCIAVNRLAPKAELKELILFNAAPYLKENDHPVIDVPVSVFQTMRQNLDSYPENEAVLRALFSHPSTFQYGLKSLERNPDLHYLRASCAVLAFNIDPFSGLRAVAVLYFHLKPKEKQLVLKLILNRLKSASVLEMASFRGYLKGFGEIIKNTSDPDLSFQTYIYLENNYPELKPGICQYSLLERFHQQEGFLSRIIGTPDEMDIYFKSFATSSLKWLINHENRNSPQVLSIIRTLFSRNQIESNEAFRILFNLRLNPPEISAPLTNYCADLILRTLSQKSWPVDAAITNERILPVARASSRKVEFILSFLELELPEMTQDSSLVELLLMHPLDEAHLRRAWPYAITSTARALFLILAIQHSALREDAFKEIQKKPIESAPLTNSIYTWINEGNYYLATSIIRHFHSLLPLDEIIPILMAKLKEAVLSFEQAESLFDLFQIPELNRFKKQHAPLVYKKIHKRSNDLLERRIYEDIKKSFSKEEISKVFIVYLISSISLYSSEEVRAELPFLIEVLKGLTDYTNIKPYLAPLARKELAATVEGRQFIDLLGPVCDHFYNIQTDLLIESQSDADFLKGIKRKKYKRFPLEYAERLYRASPEFCFKMVECVENPTLHELEALFDIFTTAPLNPGYLVLIRNGDFNALRKSIGKREKVKKLIDLMDAVTAVEMSSTPLIKDFLNNNGYQYLLKWRDEIINTKQYHALHLLPTMSYEEIDSLPILEAQFLHCKDLHPKITKEVLQLSSEHRNKFWKRMLNKIRLEAPQHCVHFFNQFIKAEGFARNNQVIDLVVLTSIIYPKELPNVLKIFLTERIKTLVPLKGCMIDCDDYNIAPIETYQKKETPVIIPYLDKPGDKAIPPDVERAFYQVLGLLMSKFVVDAVALYKSPEQAGYLLDFVAINLFYRSENIKGSPSLKTAFEEFSAPVTIDLRNYNNHLNNLNLIDSAMNPEQLVVLEPASIANRINLGNPLFASSLSYALDPLKQVIQNLVNRPYKEKPFAPVCILHALNLIKGYNIELFKEYPKHRVELCQIIFSGIEKHPEVLKFEEISFGKVLNALLPKHDGLTDIEYGLYAEFIQALRAKCYLLFRYKGPDYILKAFDLYLHILEMGYVRSDANFLNIITSIVSATDEALKLNEESFKVFAQKLETLFCLNFTNRNALLPIFTPFLKGAVNECLGKLGTGDKPYIDDFRQQLGKKTTAAFPEIFR